jgi:predicted DsbA family dithiol-disulfide isomerase
VDQHLAAKYGLAPAQLERNREALRQRGAEVGFVFNRRERVYNTFDAHRLLHWAGLEGRQRELKHELLRAYFTDGENVADHAVLVLRAAAAGLDAQRARDVLAGGDYADAVRAQEAFFAERGIQAVPSVVVNGTHLIQGGQPVDVFEQALRQIAAEKDEAVALH